MDIKAQQIRDKIKGLLPEYKKSYILYKLNKEENGVQWDTINGNIKGLQFQLDEIMKNVNEETGSMSKSLQTLNNAIEKEKKKNIYISSVHSSNELKKNEETTFADQYRLNISMCINILILGWFIVYK